MKWHLKFRNYQNDMTWEWELLDGQGKLVAHNSVELDPGDSVVALYRDFPASMERISELPDRQAALDRLSQWMGRVLLPTLSGNKLPISFKK
jgi:hypothetical protein